MTKLALTPRNHKKGHGGRESNLARLPARQDASFADNAVRHVRTAAEVTNMRDAEVEAEIVALLADARRDNIASKHRLNQLSDRFADLKRRVASFEPSTK